MSAGPLAVQLVVAFFIAAVLLYKYGNWFRHRILVTLSVLIAWYFSLLIVVILPLDVTSTIYRQCWQEHPPTTETAPTTPSSGNDTDDGNTTSVPPIYKDSPCKEPWSLVPDHVYPELWRVVYWSSQVLTWLLFPMMQSYTRSGEFTVTGKLKASLIDNAIYYGTYLLIVIILLIYLLTRPGMHLDGPKLKLIAVTASNTWGLFLLVLLLGYGLVEIPRSLWRASNRHLLLQHTYFKAAKLASEKSESEETVDDLLDNLQAFCREVPMQHPYHQRLEIILQKVPIELRERMQKRRRNMGSTEQLTDKGLARLHRQIIHALGMYRRTETQWNELVNQTLELEDVNRNAGSNDHAFKGATAASLGWWSYVYTPTVEWWWKCRVRLYLLQALFVFSVVMSVFVVWSEVTFFNRKPVLSLFALFVDLAKSTYDYFTIEMVSLVTISYLCYCAYYTVFKVRVLNFYYLAPYHQTDEYSLIFSGMMLCRLTPPLCLNFLGLIHLDSHITSDEQLEETAYTNIMGHMDVIDIVSDGFNIYFPMGILALCLATYFSLGSRILSLLGFQQFIGDDDITTDLVDEGKEMIRRERRRRERQEETAGRRREIQERFGVSGGPSLTARLHHHIHDRGTLKREPSDSQLELLQERGTTDYSSVGDTVDLNRIGGEPPRGIFDDV